MRDGRDRQALAGESAIIAAAAHELKSPLLVINYISQILHDPALSVTEEERAAYLRRLRVVSERALLLTQQLTTSYRLEDNQHAFDFALEAVNVRAVCESALQELTPYAQEYNQHLCLLPGRRPHMVVANRTVLHDVVVNLLENAIRHNSPQATVTLAARARAGSVRLAVHDDGHAISARDVRRVRQRLGKEPQPLSGHAGTSGLGLYIAGQLARAIGGRLGMGRPLVGTSFFVDLPLSQQIRLL